MQHHTIIMIFDLIIESVDSICIGTLCTRNTNHSRSTLVSNIPARAHRAAEGGERACNVHRQQNLSVTKNRIQILTV